LNRLEELVGKAHELKSKGLSTYEIAEELGVQPDTVVWLLLRGKEKVGKPAPRDVFVDWNHVGSSVRRLSLAGWALADLVHERVEKGECDEPEVVAGIGGSGLLLAYIVAEELGKPFSAIKVYGGTDESKQPGVINPSFCDPKNHKVLIVDTVAGGGAAIRFAIKILDESGAKSTAVAVLVNKTGKDKVEGIPLLSLLELLPVT
jgi:orotate phosphoribosyltransferase